MKTCATMASTHAPVRIALAATAAPFLITHFSDRVQIQRLLAIEELLKASTGDAGMCACASQMTGACARGGGKQIKTPWLVGRG